MSSEQRSKNEILSRITKCTLDHVDHVQAEVVRGCRGSAKCSRSETAIFSEMMCYFCNSTEHLANDIVCPKMAPRSRAAMQQRAETLDDDQTRELLDLRAERAHLRKIRAVSRRRRSVMVRARSMELLLRQQKSKSVLESNSPPLMPTLPLLLSPHILP